MDPKITIKQSLLAIVFFIIVYFIFYKWFDLAIAQWSQQVFPGTDLYDISRVIANILQPEYWSILGIVCLLQGLIKFKKNQSGKGFILFGGSILFSMVLCEVLKFGLARYRPIEWFGHQLYGFHFFNHAHDINGTPSGHTTAAFAGLFALTRIRRKTAFTIMMMVIASLIGISRIIVNDHYTGDVIFGAYLGILSVYWFDAFRRKYCPITRDKKQI